jgi:hypothetical protein
MELTRRAALAALTAVAATAAPASAATLHLRAPREIDRAEKFRLKAFGQAKPQRAYYLSVLYQDDSQGRCEPRLVKKSLPTSTARSSTCAGSSPTRRAGLRSRGR